MEYSNYLGKRLDGRYQIMEVIGVGGMAVVYKAYDNIDQRTVAVKILKDEFLANEEFKRRFKNESKAIALLSHENIVRVLDVSYGDMLQYIVMEYVDGITLKEYIQQQGKIDPREAIYFITQILRALQHAHDRGIVHRDVKPQNTMLQSDGTIKVTDFGIARFSRGETKTMTDSAIGSVHYFSPEQATGDATDAKTDLYAAGVVLYEMLTGSLPFQSDNAVSVALMQLQKEPALPRELNPDLPVGLEQIIMKAMQKNVSDRYQTASEMLNDIEQFKMNPNIKFNYILASTGAEKLEAEPEIYENIPVAPVRPQRQKAQTKPAEQASSVSDDSGESEIDDKTKKRNIIILSAVFVALTAVAVLLFSVFGFSSKNKIEVPMLEGLNYYTDIINNDLYANFNIVPNFRSDSTEPAGKVLEQEPQKGKKVDPGSVITVYISGAETGVEIPASIVGKNFNIVETELKALGFIVEIQTQKSEKYDIGTVINSNPAVGEKAPRGSTVVIYVATNKDVQQIEVPSLLGLTVSQAKTALENVGLTLNVTDSEYRNSTVTAGLIIGYEKAGQKVLPGTSIAVYVSNGKAPSVSTSNDESSTSSTESTTTTASTTTPTTTTEPYVEPSYEDGNDDNSATTGVTISIYIPTDDYEPEDDTTYPEEPDTEYEEPSSDEYDDTDPGGDIGGDDIVIEIG